MNEWEGNSGMLLSKDIAPVWPWERRHLSVMWMDDSTRKESKMVVNKVGRGSDPRIVSGQHQVCTVSERGRTSCGLSA